MDRNSTHDKDEEYQAEAERLAQLSVEDQNQILALYRKCAANPKLPKSERVEGQARVEALARHLRRLNREKKPK